MGEKHGNEHIFLCWDPETGLWQEAQLLRGPPMRLVRRLLGGEWTRCSGSLTDDLAAAFWNARSGRKLLVIRPEAGARISMGEA